MMDSTYTKTHTRISVIRNGETTGTTTGTRHEIKLTLSEPETYTTIDTLNLVFDEAKYYYAPDSAVIETIDNDVDPSMDVMITGYVITWTTED